MLNQEKSSYVRQIKKDIRYGIINLDNKSMVEDLS